AVSARIDAEGLILEGCSLCGQRVVNELEVLFTIANTECAAQFAGRQVGNLTLKVRFNDGLTHGRAVFKVRTGCVQAILRNFFRLQLEEIHAAGAGSRGCAKATSGSVTGSREALAEAARL